MSGELGIRTLDLQADITELAERVTAQAATIETIGGDAVRLADDGTEFDAPIPTFTLSIPRTLH